MTTTQIPNPQTFGQNGCCTPFPRQTLQNVPFNWCGPTQTGYTPFTIPNPTGNIGNTVPNTGYWSQPFGWFTPSFYGQDFHAQNHFGSYPWNFNSSFINTWHTGYPSFNPSAWNTFGSFPWSSNLGHGFNSIGWQLPSYGWNGLVTSNTPFTGEYIPGYCPPSFGSWHGANINPVFNGFYNTWPTPFNTFGINPSSTIPISQYVYNTIPFYGFNIPLYGYQGGYNWAIPCSNVPFGFGVPMTNGVPFTNTGFNGVYPQGNPFPGTPCTPQNADTHGKPGFAVNREAA